MAGPLSLFRSSVLATNDPNRLGLPFRQPSGVRSHEDLHRPLSNTMPITVRKSRSRRKMSSAPAAPLIDASHKPTGGRTWTRSIALTSALVGEGADVDPWRFVPDGGDASVLPVPGLFLRGGSVRGLRRDPEQGSGRQLAHHGRCDRRRWSAEDHPSGDGPLVCNGAGTTRRHCDVRVEPHFNRSSKSGHVCARRHLTCRSLPPEGCGTWAAARPPQPQKSGPSCRLAAARTTPVFAVSLALTLAVRAPLIRPPRRCASGG